jgi:hypothetical protein
VIQHHEHHDGTGYPSSYRGDEIGTMGQILCVADTIIALRLRRFAGSGRNIRDTVGILQIESNTYRPDVLSHAMRVLSSAGVERTGFHPYETRGELLDQLRRRARAMVSCASMLADMPNLVPVEKKRVAPVVLTAFVARLQVTLARSGLADGEITKWLSAIAEGKEEASLADLAELDLQQREILWQFRRLQLSMVAFADREGMRSRSPVRAMVERMRSFFEQLEAGQAGQPDEAGAVDVAS